LQNDGNQAISDGGRGSAGQNDIGNENEDDENKAKRVPPGWNGKGADVDLGVPAFR
jgi:hypothetical protein